MLNHIRSFDTSHCSYKRCFKIFISGKFSNTHNIISYFSVFAASQYLFQAPNRYIFHGAEVYSSSEDETSSSCGSDTDGSRCSADALENEDSDVEEDGAPVTDKNTDGLAETVQDSEHKRLQTDCTAETDLQTTQ